MTSSLVKPHKILKRTETKKSHSWWWDSHVSPRNSKWLAESLEEMDQSVKRMLKLIEEDADSFAKKAEMYYQKRPELISHVEEFYRMYRSLAERYDNVTGELRRNLPSDLQSQGSGLSDVGSEPISTCPSPDQRLSRRKSGPRAAGFEVFLGSGGSSSDLGNKDDDSSTVDYESGSDDSSINNYPVVPISGEEEGLRKKITELEIELRDIREKLRRQQEENMDRFSRECKHGNFEDLLARIEGYEREMRDAREKILVSNEEIARLKSELRRNRSDKVTEKLEDNLEISDNISLEHHERIYGFKAEVLEPECKIQTLEEELKITREKLQGSDKEISNLRHDLENSKSSIQRIQDQLKSAQKDVAMWKSKVNKEQREVSKLQDRIVRYKSNLSDRDQEIRALKETVSNANKSLSEENMQLQAEITKLAKERMYLEDNIREWDLRCQSLEEEVKRVKAGKTEMEDLLKTEIDQLKVAFKLEYDSLVTERDEISDKVKTLVAEVNDRDDRIEHLDRHLKQLHMEHVALIAGTENAHKLVDVLRLKVKGLEEEVQKQKEMIREGAEEKREAIRQLCFSLEHYRNGYQHLRKVFVGNKRLPVMAS